MVYLRGHPSDFDNWAKSGCAGWDYDSVLPFFRRARRSAAEIRATAAPTGRCVPAPARPEANPLSQVFLDGAAAAGFPLTDDFNGALAEGAGWHDLSISGGIRQSTAAAYLHPLRDCRPNLTVIDRVSRARSCASPETVATGVEFEHRRELMTAYADAEVVVSAGAVDSPRLLLLSGVGPAAELEAAGVGVVHDLPGVGRNLHDHPLCGVVYEAAQPIPAGRTNHAETSLLWRSDESLAGPDMQLMFIHVPFHPPHLAAPANSFTFAVATVPEARGSIRLAGPDPATPPSSTRTTSARSPTCGG